jgi:hypothetical protein
MRARIAVTIPRMTKDITFEVDDEVYAAFERTASHLGMRVPEYVLWKLDLSTPRLSMAEWVERTRNKPHSNIKLEETLAILDEWRGPWPEPQDEASSSL